MTNEHTPEMTESALALMLDCPCRDDVPVLVAEVKRRGRMIDFLASAAANAVAEGSFGGVRQNPEFWRKEAERFADK